MSIDCAHSSPELQCANVLLIVETFLHGTVSGAHFCVSSETSESWRMLVCRGFWQFDAAILRGSLHCWLCGLRQCRSLTVDMINDGRSLFALRQGLIRTILDSPDIHRQRCALPIDRANIRGSPHAVSQALPAHIYTSHPPCLLFMIQNLSKLFPDLPLLRVLWPRHW